MKLKLSFLTSTTLAVLIASGCGTDERIQGVSSTAEDSGAADDDDADDDITDPFADDDADDDTTPVPTGRPTPTPTPTPSPTVLTSDLGIACSANADCGDGLSCMQADTNAFWGGGPANGMCTLTCASDFDCLAVDSNSVCIPTSADAVDGTCVPACTPGDGLLGETKCGGRLDMACLDLDTIAICLPMCGTDADCGDGRFCDLGFGNCVDEPLSGDSIGTACDPAAEENECSTGYCLGLNDEFGMCSGACRTGTIGCGSGSAMPEDPGEPICLALGTGVGVDGDFGSCIQRCNCDLDCLHPDALCWAQGDTEEEAIAAFGTIGLCIDGAFASDPEFADERIGIECDDDRPMMSEAGVPDGGGNTPLLDSGPPSNPSEDASQPEPAPTSDAAASDGG